MLACEFERRRHPTRWVVNASTDVVVEGYPGSANSFVRAALLAADPQLQIASHLHTVSHVRRAVALKRPTLVLVREPADAVTSHAVRFLGGDVRFGLREYLRFHRGLERVREGALLVTFAEATQDLAGVMRRVNDYFDSRLPAVDTDDPAIRSSIDRQLAEAGEDAFGAGREDIWEINNDERAERAAAVSRELHSPALWPMLQRAEEQYRRLVAQRRQACADSAIG